LTGSLGKNTLLGGPGNDTLRARDTVLLTPPDDIVFGQSGSDRCQTDINDNVSCEIRLP
jgi:Ca2+-binding RTX toxin-like protein